MIDTHAHLYSEKLRPDLGAVVARAEAAGIHKIFMPNIDRASIEPMLETAARFPNLCLPMMGLHPCSVGTDFEKDLYLVEEWLGRQRFLAVGEMGLDLYWDKSFFPQQQEAFRIQAGFAKKHSLPLVIHTRESTPETIALLEELQDGSLTGIVHCFTGTLEEALKITGLGFCLGIGGVATFKNGGLDKVLPDLPPDMIVLETDSPYLAPQPHRGKRNEPAYVALVAEKAAALLNMETAALEALTDQNAMRVYQMET